MVSTMSDIHDSGALSGPLADAPYPRPGADPAEIRRYFRGNPGVARISVVGQLISAASLARLTASVAKLAGRAGGHEGCGPGRSEAADSPPRR